jgi:hypothetical protein
MKPIRISLTGLLFRLGLILLSWSSFFWFDAIEGILIGVPTLLVLLLLSTLLARGPLSSFAVEISQRQARISTIIVIALIVAAPLYARYYGMVITNHLVHELGLNTMKISQQVSSWGDLGARSRYVLAVYQLQEPLESAKQKIDQRLQTEPMWEKKLDYRDRQMYLCAPEISLGNLIIFEESDRLIIDLSYANPEPACFLRN